MKSILANEEIYHIFNRGIERKPVFTCYRELDRAIKTLDYYRFKNISKSLAKALVLETTERKRFYSELKKKEKLVEVISYCFLPNHFHFLLKQISDNGIKKFISDFTNSYTRYFNMRNKRIGPLFEGIFKSARIESNEQLIHVSRYIHLNPVTAFLVKEEKIGDYKWSSYPEYMRRSAEKICDIDIIANQFESKEDYQRFVLDRAEYAKELEKIKHLLYE